MPSASDRRPPRWLLPLVAFGVLAAAPWLLGSSYYRYVATLTIMYMALSTSWNIMGGLTGYVSLGHAAFFGLGAYWTGLVVQALDVPPFAAALAAGPVVALAAAAVGFVALRVRGASFVIVTLSLVYILGLTAQAWRGLTGGSSGLTLPSLGVGGDLAHLPFYYAFLALFGGVMGVSQLVRRSTFGLRLVAIREDEEKAATLGIDTDTSKLVAFVLSAAFVGIGGGLYAYWRVFLDPIFVFSITVSVTIILVALLGGIRHLWGPALGAVLFVPASYQLLTTLPDYHLLATGLLLGAVVLFLPDGIIPSLRDATSRRGAASIREQARDDEAAQDEAAVPATADPGGRR